MKLLTNLLFEPKGMHNPALAYSIKDTVMSADGSRVYFALQDVPAGTALDNEDYWKLQIDLSSSKSAMDQALASFGDYAKSIGARVRGETANASGNPVSFLPDAGSLLAPVTAIEPQQQGSGAPSPENIRPFIGLDKLGLGRTGKNLCPNHIENGSSGGVTWVKNADGSIRVAGTCTEETVIPFCGNGSYDAIGIPGGRWLMLHPHFGVRVNKPDGDVAYYSDQAFYLNPGEVISMVYLHFHPGESYDYTAYPQIELGEQRTAYAPYMGNVYTVHIGRTVYGVRHEWLTGKTRIEWAMAEFDGSDDENWNPVDMLEGGCRYFISVPDLLRPESNAAVPCFLSNKYTAIAPNDSYLGAAYGVSGQDDNDIIWINDARFASGDVAAFRAELAVSPVQIVYKLAAPIEIGPFTPHIISAADPEQTNTLYGDGSIEVEYVKPLYVSIEERVAAAVAAAMNAEGV